MQMVRCDICFQVRDMQTSAYNQNSCCIPCHTMYVTKCEWYKYSLCVVTNRPHKLMLNSLGMKASCSALFVACHSVFCSHRVALVPAIDLRGCCIVWDRSIAAHAFDMALAKLNIVALLQRCQEEWRPAETECTCGQNLAGEEKGIWSAAQGRHCHQSAQGMPSAASPQPRQHADLHPQCCNQA